jgi:hypothetical protein
MTHVGTPAALSGPAVQGYRKNGDKQRPVRCRRCDGGGQTVSRRRSRASGGQTFHAAAQGRAAGRRFTPPLKGERRADRSRRRSRASREQTVHAAAHGRAAGQTVSRRRSRASRERREGIRVFDAVAGPRATLTSRRAHCARFLRAAARTPGWRPALLAATAAPRRRDQRPWRSSRRGRGSSRRVSLGAGHAVRS